MLMSPASPTHDRSGADYTLFFRQLSQISLAQARHVAESEGGAGLSAAISMLEIVSPSFYEGTPAAPLAEEWTQWLARYARLPGV